MTNLTESFLRELEEAFDYDPDTGVIRWRTSHCRKVKAGTLVGTFDGRGYRKCAFKGVRIKCHRLAWMLFYKREPVGVVDHINGIRDDNRIANLREVSHSANSQNKGAPLSTNKLGVMGVMKTGSKFWAAISVNGKSQYIGTFLTVEEAHQAYLAEKSRLHVGFVPERFAK